MAETFRLWNGRRHHRLQTYATLNEEPHGMFLLAEIAWQPIIAYALVALAAIWVLRRSWRLIRRATRSGSRPGETISGCGSCPQNLGGAPKPKAKPLVQLNPKPPTSES